MKALKSTSMFLLAAGMVEVAAAEGLPSSNLRQS